MPITSLSGVRRAVAAYARSLAAAERKVFRSLAGPVLTTIYLLTPINLSRYLSYAAYCSQDRERASERALLSSRPFPFVDETSYSWLYVDLNITRVKLDGLLLSIWLWVPRLIGQLALWQNDFFSVPKIVWIRCRWIGRTWMEKSEIALSFDKRVFKSKRYNFKLEFNEFPEKFVGASIFRKLLVYYFKFYFYEN